MSTSEPRMPPPKITHLQNAALILASGRRGRLHLSNATTRPAYLANHPSFSPDFVCRATPKTYLRLQIKRYFRIENVKAPTHQAKAGAEPQKNQCRTASRRPLTRRHNCSVDKFRLLDSIAINAVARHDYGLLDVALCDPSDETAQSESRICKCDMQ